MQKLAAVTFILPLLSLKWSSVSGLACFKLNSTEDNFVVLNVNSENVRHTFHYRLNFETTQSHTLIFYTEGPHRLRKRPYDYEALYIREGNLNYFAFNPAPYGAGSSFGSHFVTNFTVNHGDTVQVEFFRNRERVKVNDEGESENIKETGMIVDGQVFAAEGLIENMDLGDYVWLGGFTDVAKLSKDLMSFDGMISNLYDVRTGHTYDTPNGISQYESVECPARGEESRTREVNL